MMKIMRIIKDVTGRRVVQRGLLAYGLAFPFVLFFGLEGLNPVSAQGLMAAPLAGFGIIMLSALLIACAAVFVFGFVGRVFWSYAVVSAVLGAAYLVNNLKLMLAGQVFVPTDLMIAGEALMVTDVGDITIERALLLRVAFVVLLHVPLLFIKFCPRFKKRVVASAGALVVFLPLFGINASAGRILTALDVTTTGSLTALYRETGFIVGFHAALVDHNARSPAIAAAGETVMDFFPEPRAFGEGAGLNPDVIVIMSEAFMDPAVLYNLEFSTDPVANFRRLSQEHISGQLIVPVFGGGTANTEFEFLTGTAMFFMGSAYYVPYNNTGLYFFRDIHTALPWLFRHNGYRTVAVHPYTRYFFRRNQVYPRMGFEEFIGYEDMENPVYKGEFVSDEFFTDLIIEQIIMAQEDGVPLFLFGISMQNHWNFGPEKYEGWPLDVTAASHLLNYNELGIVNSYLQGLYDADKQLQRLVEFVEARERPTVIVFFGDHLPLLGNQNENVFERLGYTSGSRAWLWDVDDVWKMYSLPYLVWSNFADAGEYWGTISPYFLAANMLRLSGIDLNRYWHHVLYANEHFGALTEIHFVDGHGDFLLQRFSYVMERPYIRAMEALHQVKWFGTDELHSSLKQLVTGE